MASNMVTSCCRCQQILQQVLLPRTQVPRTLTTSCVLLKRTPKERDPSKRNFHGDRLIERLKSKEADIRRQEPYRRAVEGVVAAFRSELEEENRRRQDLQGETMMREEAEREQALKDYAIIARSNEELRRQREVRRLIEEDERVRKDEQILKEKEEKREEARRMNTELVLRAIEESADFITPDNLEEKIEFALDNEVSYNFALTPDGKKLHSSKPPSHLGPEWKQPSPSAYILGGMQPGSTEWNFIFKDRVTGFKEKKAGFERRAKQTNS